MQRILFLDIDGVMIPGTQFLVDPRSSLDRKFPQTTIAVLNEILKRTGAQVVINSTHSAPAPNTHNIDDALIFHGIHPQHFHPAVSTRTPLLDRMSAINEWIAKNGDADWLALDDSKFTDDERLILVDPQPGLHIGHLDIILDRWGLPPCLILI